MNREALVRDVSDTALWVAVYRARESERPDALFRDPLAARLAGRRGEEIARSLSSHESMSWPMVTRTWLGDRSIEQALASGADMVVNLAAGLDTRPYRMRLPSALRWVEVDRKPLLSYKEDILKDEKPVCRLERLACDLADGEARRALFERLGREAKNALVISEGLLIYLESDAVAALAKDLHAVAGFTRWQFDLASPGLLMRLRGSYGEKLANAPMRFGPPEGPAFFEPLGWSPLEVHSYLKTAAALKRLPFFLHLASFLPESNGRQGSRPWCGFCLMRKS